MEIFDGTKMTDYFPRIFFSFEEEDDYEFEPMAAVDCE
jgi:hypothetical protein